MTSRFTNARAPWRLLAGLVLSALTLAACGTVVGPKGALVTGTPSLSIDVPLQITACTGDNHCLAVGTTGGVNEPTSVGESRSTTANWHNLNVPSAPSTIVTSASCWQTGCLLGGVSPSGDLLWRYDASTDSVTPVATPRAGQGVSALSCYASSSCLVIDTTGVAGVSRVSATLDGGDHWSSPRSLAWSNGANITGLSCATQQTLNCLAVVRSPSLALEVSNDGGVTWRNRPIPSSWTSLSSLTCRGLTCNALATTSRETLRVATTTFGRLWRSHVVSASPRALACSTSACTLAGSLHGGAFLATLRHATLVTDTLAYVPAPLTSVACGSKLCVGANASTVLSLRP